jgi:transaldolase
MKIFLDTIDLKIIKRFYNTGILYGVTTNPTLAKKFGMSSDTDMVEKIRQVMPIGEIHIEAFGNTREEIYENALRINSITKDKFLVYKVPFSDEGVAAVKLLKQKGLKTNLHLIFSINQALIASAINSDYICPLVGRLDDIGHDASENIKTIRICFNNYGETINTKIMASSIRHPKHVSDAFQVGADVVTIPSTILEKMFYHPLTSQGYDAFHEDIRLMQPIDHDEINKCSIVSPGDTLKVCLQKMYKRKINTIVAQEGKRIGICTMGDIKRLLVEGSFNLDEMLNKKISSFLNFNCVTIEEGSSYEDIKNLAIKSNTKEIIITKNNNLLGIFSL